MKNLKENSLISILTNLYYSEEVSKKIPSDKYIELDLGCGKGTFTMALAQKYQDRFILGADIMVGRLRKIDNKIEHCGLNNIALFRVEARHFVCCFLGDSAVDRMHILCPDPWPKHRHKGNRLMASEFIGQIHRTLKRDGILHFSTDETKYFDTACRLMDASGLFKRDDSLISDVGDIKTDFEKRWNSIGKDVHHAAWRRLECPFIPR